MILKAQNEDEKAVILAYVASKMGTTPKDVVGDMPYTAIATARGSRPTGGVIYTNYRGHSLEMSCAGEPGWLMPRDLGLLFGYAFVTLGCFTVITTVMRRNDRARRFNEKLGFEHLGVVESGQTKGDDTILYKMTRPKCRWIKQPAANVIAFPKATAHAGAVAHGQ